MWCRGAFSEERDYRSRAASLDMRWSTPDNNTTLYAGAGLTRDDINPVNGVVENEHRRTDEYMLGITQAWTKNDLVQLNIGHVSGRGYFNDPYKLVDKRPRQRGTRQTALARWNHHIEPLGVTIRPLPFLSRHLRHPRPHRHCRGRAPAGRALHADALAALHTQGKADFYYDPVYDPVIGRTPPARPARLSSSDHRLSAFGATTVGASSNGGSICDGVPISNTSAMSSAALASGWQWFTRPCAVERRHPQIGFSRRF